MSEKTFGEWLSGLDLDFWGTARHRVTPAQFFERWQSGEDVVLLDIRSHEEAQYMALPFALHIPIDELPQRRGEIPRDKLVATFCSAGVRASIAYAYLQLQGLENVRIFAGGYPDLMEELKASKVRKLLKETP